MPAKWRTATFWLLLLAAVAVLDLLTSRAVFTALWIGTSLGVIVVGALTFTGRGWIARGTGRAVYRPEGLLKIVSGCQSAAVAGYYASAFDAWPLLVLAGVLVVPLFALSSRVQRAESLAASTDGSSAPG